jgi:hypothetical protein
MHTLLMIFMFMAGGILPEEEVFPPEKNGVPYPQINLCFWPPDMVPHPPHVPEDENDGWV